MKIAWAEAFRLADESGVAADGRGVQALVADALRRHPARMSTVVCSVQRSSATVRLLSLPPAGAEDIDKIVRLEAGAHLPFPLDNAELAHYKMSSPDGQTRVMIAACPKVTVAARRQLLAEAGASPTEVSVSTVASYNCLLRVYPALREGTHLAVDLGADSTEIAVISEGELASSLTLAQGGRALTLSLARDLGCDTAAAERRKVEEGVGLDPATGLPPDPNAYFSTTTWFQKLHGGLQRAIDSQAGGAPGRPVEAIVLLGGGALMPGLRESLEAALGLRVGIADPMALLGWSPEGGPTRPSVDLVTAAGLALQGVGLAALPLDLTPTEVLQRQQARLRRSLGWVGIVAFVIVLLGLSAWQALALYRANQSYQSAVATFTAARAQFAGIRLSDTEMEGLRWIRTRSSDPANDPLDILALLSERLPLEMSLRDLNFRRGESVALKGTARSNAKIAEAVKALRESNRFPEVTLTHSTATQVGDQTLYMFEIECGLPKGGEGQ
jgi:type IV pilus assembly protein PilM